MSHPTEGAPAPAGRATATVDDEGAVTDFLGALDDPKCRGIIAATADEALTAGELSETCDLPLSTTYRKLDLLTDAGLLAERTRLCPSGHHPSEYVRNVDDVMVSMGDGGVELAVSGRNAAGNELFPPEDSGW